MRCLRHSKRPPFDVEAHAGIMRHLNQSPIQCEGAQWHCAARREIAERSEEAPEAEAAQPSRMMEYGRPLWANPWEWRHMTSPAGSSGGSAEGASEGRQPLTGPHLPPAAQAAQTA